MSDDNEGDNVSSPKEPTIMIRGQLSQTNDGDLMTKTQKNEEQVEPIEWIDEGSEEEEARVELGLVRQIWTERHVNQNAFITTMKNVWQPKHDIDINNMGKNLYVFQFHHWRDKQKVLEGRPWHFDRHVILLDEVKGNCKSSDLQLTFSDLGESL